MRTEHRIHVSDAREMTELEEGSVQLVVTSPPYPMIEMWDELFADLDPAIGEALAAEDGEQAFDRMHALLAQTWSEVHRVLEPGGIACINVGDATRSLADSFRMWPNHVRVIEAFTELGFQPLPDILWRKPANSAAKFMGSGMLPPNAYATLEHEYILVFRKGRRRSFEPNADRRYEAAYFWEERNQWFSDVWMDVRGTLQDLDDSELRERSAAFPFELPYRLISMYTAYEDTVLDPFWGTGTTTMAAMAAGRSSVGYEIEDEFTSYFEERVTDIQRLSRQVGLDRLQRHREFVEERQADRKSLNYDAENYEFPVTTKQEKNLQLYAADDVRGSSDRYVVEHTPLSSQDGGTVPSGPNGRQEDGQTSLSRSL
ncbi:modification methylase [Thermoplasmatales archaeon SW_10_69_26]|nr:MAG: modification methylase [Thermoplasmatales archaeon SW_10_69_26]